MGTSTADERLTDAEAAALTAADRAAAAAEYASWLGADGELTVPAEWLAEVPEEFLTEIFETPLREPGESDPEVATRHVEAGDLAGVAPGRELVDLLLEADRWRADAYTTLEELAAWDRVNSWAAGRVRELASLVGQDARLELGPVAPRAAGTRNTNFAGEEVAMRLGCSKQRGRNLIRSGDALRNECIPTADALAAGEIDAAKAEIIVAGVEHLSPDQALEVQDIVLPRAAHQPHHQVRQDVARAVAEVDQANFTQRPQAAAKKRRVDRPRPLGDGMSSLYAVLPTLDAAAMDAALDGAARAARAAGDPNTIEALRADFLGLFGHTALATGAVEVRLPLDTDGPIVGATVTTSAPVPGPTPGTQEAGGTRSGGTATDATTGTSPSEPAAPVARPDRAAVGTAPVGGPCRLPPAVLGLVAPFDASALMADGIVPTAAATARYRAIAERTGMDREVVVNAMSPAGIAWYRDRIRAEEYRRAHDPAHGPVVPVAGALPGMPMPPAPAPSPAPTADSTATSHSPGVRAGTDPGGAALPTGAQPATPAPGEALPSETSPAIPTPGAALPTGAQLTTPTPGAALPSGTSPSTPTTGAALPAQPPTSRHQRVDPLMVEIRGPSRSASRPESAFGGPIPGVDGDHRTTSGSAVSPEHGPRRCRRRRPRGPPQRRRRRRR
ncbi:DUF222 domain-containing protein [Occultella glacieicola]|uniref:DUF222 domain-containing protein n=1 Tax=Occultella glacieicola TaxID=2518684 RepID=A0ABY2DYK8_9MICO|nr:DUF222 domain-containing protein [Occultella glacieicola]TDE88904.1 DUF222 domain-containing protein [Occultella glacieicola]